MNKFQHHIKTHWQRYLDIYIFLNFIGWIGWQTFLAVNESRFDFIEGSFLVQNSVLAILFLIRRPSKENDPRFFHQLVALTAFFSGALLVGNPITTNASLLLTSKTIILISNGLGIFTLLNLGKSFGIMISFRKVKTNGLYSVVRHPMYVTDILLRIGFLISHLTIFAGVVFVVSTGCYVYRAILEERFLKKQPEYLRYMNDVKYRFIPFIF
jgi:protein-S-isoprenylcysteine O-methyltransferase Ste14